MGKGDHQAPLGNICADQRAGRQHNAVASHGRRHGERCVFEIRAAQLTPDIANPGQVEPLRPSRAVVKIRNRGIVDQGMPEKVTRFA